MHFPNITAAISSLLMVIASASTSASFEVPGTGSGIAVVPGAPEGVTTTTVYGTSTYYITSAITVPTPVGSVSLSISASTESNVAPSSGYAMPPVPANSSAVTPGLSETAPPAEITPTQSLYVTGSQTFVPVTLWENSTTRIIYPQNSTALEILTGYPANGTAPSTVVVTTSASQTVVTTSKHTSATAEPSATVSEVLTNGAGKIAVDAVLGMGLVAGFIALL
ncbi:hypothetical protein E8E11_010808 [Didymella keratinophila]|nr:hypothetical protein E8E11_010808 [Didymella keratinophila]